VQVQPVNLHHHAVGLEIELGDQRFVVVDLGLHFFQRVEPFVIGLYGKPPLGEQLQFFGVRRGRQLPFDRFDGEDEHPESAFARECRIELAKSAGRGVARVGKGRLAFCLPRLVHPLEAGVGHVHLAPHLHQLGVSRAFK
jgi:hypothetical protein